MIHTKSRGTITKKILKKLNIQGVIVSLLILIGLFGPWLAYSYDSYPSINPETNMGQLNYHSRIELNPLFGSMYKDDVLIGRYLFISVGVSISGVLIAISATLSIFKYNYNWIHFILFTVASTGFILFFLSIGGGISIGVFTKIGWGLKLTGVGILVFFVVSLSELSRDSISRFMD